MSKPAPSSQLPLFVPRVALASERTATQLARRIMAPVRAIGARATRFADRVVGGWLGTAERSTVASAERPVARVVPQAGMLMPRPWYELDEEPAIAAPIRRSAAPEAAAAAAPIAREAVAPAIQTAAAERAPEPTLAERGASITRTQLEAPPEVRVAAAERAPTDARRAEPAAPTSTVAPPVVAAPAPIAPPTVAPPIVVAPEPIAPQAAAPQAAVAPSTATASPPIESAVSTAPTAAGVDAPAAPRAQVYEPVSSSTVNQPIAAPPVETRAAAPVAAETRELRAAEALGLRAVAQALETRAAAVEPARPLSAIARALNHASWVDAQLRVLSSPAETAEPRALAPQSASYVWVTPAAPEMPAAARPQRRVETPAVEHEATRVETPVAPTLPLVAPVETRPAMAAPELAAPAPAPSPISPFGMPDLRLEAALPQAAVPFAPAARLTQFLDRLVGSQAGRDVEALPVAFTRQAQPANAPLVETAAAPTFAPIAPPLSERAPTREFLRLPDAPAPETVEARPIAAAATVEDSPAVASPIAASPSTAEPRAAVEPPRAEAAPAPAPTVTAAERAATPIAPAPVMTAERQTMRPGAIAMRAEQLASFVDVRAAAAWGEPLPTVRAAERPAPAFAYVAAPADERRPAPTMEAARAIAAEQRAAAVEQQQRAAARAAQPAPLVTPAEVRSPAPPTETRRAPAAEAPRVAAAFEPRARFEARPALEARSELELVTALAARPTGPAAIAQFIDRLVGVGAVRSTASLPLDLAASRAPARAPAREYVHVEGDRAVSPAARPAASVGAAAARPSIAAAPVEAARATASAQAVSGAPAAARAETRAATAPAMTVLRPGGIAVWAEQMAGSIGVRAASLSIDFVDPSRLPALSSGRASGELTYLWPTVTGDAPVERSAPRATQAAAAAATGNVEAPRAAASASFAPGAALSQEEWSLVATFPSAATAIQVASARRAAQWSGGAPARTLLTASPQAAPARALPSGSMTSGSVTSGGAGPSGSSGAAASPGARAPLVTPALAAAERSLESAPRGFETPGERAPIAARPSAQAARGGAPSEYVAPSASAPVESSRAMLPGGRMPRGSFTWPRSAGFSPATSEWTPSRAQSAGDAAAEAAPGTPLWGAMRPLVSLAGGRAEAPRAEQPRTAGSLDGALEFARPFLELIRGGVAPSEGGGASSSSSSVRFTEQSQPLVSAAPSSEAAAKMVEAVRSPSQVGGASDDRVSLADLTLISVASATQQVAAAATGSSPTTSAPAAESHGGGGGGGGKSGGKKDDPNEVEHLARQVFDELQRHIEIARERSGDPWES